MQLGNNELYRPLKPFIIAHNSQSASVRRLREMKESECGRSDILVLVEMKCSGFSHCRQQTGSDLHSVAAAFSLTNRNGKRRQPTAT